MNESGVSIRYIKGIGPARAALFERLGVLTVDDLLRYYPRGWEDRRLGRKIAAGDNSLAVLKVKIGETSFQERRGRLGVFKAEATDENGRSYTAVWFKRMAFGYDSFAQLKKSVLPGRELLLIARTDADIFGNTGPLRVEEYYEPGSPEAELHAGRIVPVYPLTDGLNAKFVRQAVHNALAQYAPSDETLPLSLLRKRHLPELGSSVRGMHFPQDDAALENARKRLAYEEFFTLACAWAIKRRQTRAQSKPQKYEVRKTLLTPFRNQLGFEFTAAQKRVINEIFSDLESARPMTRLLQGDVGSGKTVVALSALLLAAENGHQGVFMAPTEILAEQHYLTMKKFLRGLPVRFELLTSATPKAARKKILAGAADGSINMLVGTHALLEDNVAFSALRLAVIDEQHRFGVKQRAALRRKSDCADLLVMTATPIPRTLALALYGDLDISSIDELPPGRIPIQTMQLPEAAAFDKVREQLSQGRQAYIVHPVIDESKLPELKAVTAEFEELSKAVFPEFRLAMLHGRMKAAEKAGVMDAFSKGEINALVATPVIEVGIDVKNATVMLVRNAERFGLASLHQLRGRVGRGAAQSFCILSTHSKSADALSRLDTICSTSDGFKIGEADMELRGHGEFMGERQHGDSDFAAADLSRDRELLEWALADRDALFSSDPDLSAPENQAFKKRLSALYTRRWHLIDFQ
ncbi:MAG: ATP-dependent DNA helicase RecG [Elusimicrobia bacterium]|nr:ATP-dependent DNA helicase RecG [Elusimicrobiota bacterium]